MITKTTFVKLPEQMRQPIKGGCACTFCTSNPQLTPKWDTIACGDTGTAWTVHYPELIAVEVRQ